MLYLFICWSFIYWLFPTHIHWTEYFVKEIFVSGGAGHMTSLESPWAHILGRGGCGRRGWNTLCTAGLGKEGDAPPPFWSHSCCGRQSASGSGWKRFKRGAVLVEQMCAQGGDTTDRPSSPTSNRIHLGKKITKNGACQKWRGSWILTLSKIRALWDSRLSLTREAVHPTNDGWGSKRNHTLGYSC